MLRAVRGPRRSRLALWLLTMRKMVQLRSLIPSFFSSTSLAASPAPSQQSPTCLSMMERLGPLKPQRMPTLSMSASTGCLVHLRCRHLGSVARRAARAGLGVQVRQRWVSQIGPDLPRVDR